MGFVTDDGLKNLKNYKYNGGVYSWLDIKMNPFWYWIANQLPEWMAPNFVTLCGFICILSSYLTMMYFDLSLQKDIPRWVFLKAAIEIFAF